jgi:DNA-binding NarL/FixJ family response regulator
LAISTQMGLGRYRIYAIASLAMALAVTTLDSVERPLARLRLAIEQAERELGCLREAYMLAVELARKPAPSELAGQVRGAGALSRRELRVAELLGEGLSNREIAASLHVSVHTIKSQVQSILRKRGLHSRWQVVGGAGADSD